MTTFIVLSPSRGHYENSPGSSDECSLSARWPPTVKPSQLTWPVNRLVDCYHPHPPMPFITITQPESWYSFCQLMACGRLSRPRHCSRGVQPVPNAVYISGCRDKHNNCPNRTFADKWHIDITVKNCCAKLKHNNLLFIRYGDSAGNTAEENSSIFSLIRMR